MKSIKEYIRTKKAEYRKEHIAALRESFDVAERDGYIWLMLNGVAFFRAESIASAGEVATKLNEARDCAIMYERLCESI